MAKLGNVCHAEKKNQDRRGGCEKSIIVLARSMQSGDKTVTVASHVLRGGGGLFVSWEPYRYMTFQQEKTQTRLLWTGSGFTHPFCYVLWFGVNGGRMGFIGEWN